MLLLHNTIQRYDWGRHDGVAAIVGAEPSGGPEAELWVGAHPGAPSTVVDDGPPRSLAEVIASDPARWLGDELVGRGVTQLPFLLKILAVGGPLSLQAHPSEEQADAGFAREEAAGIPVDDPTRTYKDASAKPESLVALTETWALCGFRHPSEASALVGGLALAELDPLVKALASGSAGASRDALAWLLHVESPERDAIAEVVAGAVRGRRHAPDRTDPYGWVGELASAHPGDLTVLAPLLLQLVRLAPGDAVHLPAGNLHAYLEGAGIELMSASDNVLRGGLTAKHIDVDELLDVVRFEPGTPPPPRRSEPRPGVTVYDSGEDDYGLVVVDPAAVPGARPVEIDPAGPSLLLATGGPVDVAGPADGVSIDGGAAVFVAPGEGPLAVSGPGRLWWATVGTALPR